MSKKSSSEVFWVVFQDEKSWKKIEDKKLDQISSSCLKQEGQSPEDYPVFLWTGFQDILRVM